MADRSNGGYWFALVMGVMVGVILTIGVLLPLLGQQPSDYTDALKPVAEARGFSNLGEIITSEEARNLLNPCVVEAPLSEECRKYVVNGVVTQPPIKIVVDPDPPKKDPR